MMVYGVSLVAAAALATGGGGGNDPQVAQPAEVRTIAQTPIAQADAVDPLTLEVAYTADVWSNVRGGMRRGTRYLDNLDVIATADLDRLIGVPRTTAALYVLYNNGTPFSGSLVGDAQVLSNIETGVRALRVYEAWVEHHGADDRWSVKAGLYDLNSEFDALETSLLFLNSVHGIGTDISQSGRNGPSIFPSTSLAVRGQARLGERLTVRAAVLDGVPNDPDRPGRMLFKIGGGDGALVIGEADLSLGRVRVIAGGWHYTARADSLLDSETGAATVRQVHNRGAYVRSEAQLSGDENRGMRGFLRLGIAEGRTNPFGGLVSGGLTWRGLIPGRPDDDTGIAVGHAFPSGAQRDVWRASTGTARPGETVVEVTHRLPLTDWLSVQPDLQYVVNPGLDPSLRNALAVGIRIAAGVTL